MYRVVPTMKGDNCPDEYDYDQQMMIPKQF